MATVYDATYVPPANEPLTHARLACRNNWKAPSSMTANSTATGYSPDYADNTTTYDAWMPTITLDARLTANFATAKTCDYCCIAAHTLGSENAVVEIRANNGSGTYVKVMDQFTVTNDEPIFCIFDPYTSTDFRVKIVSSDNPVKIGVVKFGEALVFDRPAFAGIANPYWARNTERRANLSETGEILGWTVQRKTIPFEFTVKNLKHSWFKAKAWRKTKNSFDKDPIFLSWRPETYGSVVYGVVTNDAAPVYNGTRNLADVTLQIQGYGWAE